jgi:cyclophilin family peptidyl-prolyl cis-trans isomerase
MNLIRIVVVACIVCVSLASTLAFAQTATPKKGYGDLLKATQPGDWRPLDNDNTLYLELAGGRVVMELAPAFAPNHAANIKALAREGYFDGLVIMRAQENYVVQWGDPTEKKVPKSAKKSLPAEFSVPIKKDMTFTRLPDVDGYAKEVGFANGFHSGRDAKNMWLTHCYATLGVGRDNDVDSGGGTELYVVIGHAPRHLDRNITLVGRVVQGMPLLTTLPRGTGQLGFYEKDEQRVPIKALRVAADVPAAERSNLEIIRTDTPMFKDMVEALRNRGGDWYKVPAGHIELCNVPMAVREKSAEQKAAQK